MNDVVDVELKLNDYIVISANVSTSYQKILLGKIITLKPKSVNVRINTLQNGYYKNDIRKTYVSNIRSSDKLFIVSAECIPEYIKEVLDNDN